jgi:hypothetical protein
MKNPIVKKTIFIKKDKKLHKLSIFVGKPKIIENSTAICEVIFDGISKYDAVLKGIDEFNALDCAIEYIKTIYYNSEEPEFFDHNAESIRVVSR